MPHVRQQIRGAAKTALTGLASTGSRVYVGRSRALEAGHGASLLIYTTDETSAVDAMGRPKKLARDAMLLVEGRVALATAEAAENLLDEISLEVETAIAGHELGGLARELTLVSTRKTVTAEGEHHLGAIALEFRVRYRTVENAPGTAIS